MSEKEHDKDAPKNLKNDLDIEKENGYFPSYVVSGPIVTYKQRVPYSHALDAPFPYKKDKRRDDIWETFK